MVERAIHRPMRGKERERVSGLGSAAQVDQYLHRWADSYLPCSGCPWNVAECGNVCLRRGGA